jgi:starch-binding outer membrane protein, SusD/RagB family
VYQQDFKKMDMRLRNFIYSSGLLLALTFATSCNKWLELAPQDGITRQEYWKTKEDINAALVGCYSSLVGSPNGVSDRAITEYIFTWGEIRADMITQSPVTLIEQKDIMDVNIDASNSLTSWTAFYRTINFCNTVLDFAPAVKALDPTLTETQLNIYMGQALAIRSLMYFYLTRTFDEVPLKLVSTSKDSDIKNIGKSSQEVVLNQIVKDLKQAEAWLPQEYSTVAAINKGNITRLAVNAMLADVYLWMEQYENCIIECKKITDYADANPTKLGYLGASSAWWSIVFEAGSSRETIFEFSNSSSVQNSFYSLFISGQKRYLASSALTETFFIPDATNTTFSDVRGDDKVFFRASDNAISKYGEENPSFVNWQVYRYSDVKLIMAEALALTQKGEDALNIVTDLRGRRSAVSTTAPPNLGPDDTDGICDFILAERAREFAFEGKRWYDVLRNAKRTTNGVKYARLNLLLDMAATSVAPALQQTAMNKLRDYNSHYLPINAREIFADPTLVQNPFYK